MPASGAQVGYGLTCSVGGTAVEELISVSTPGFKLEAVDVTHMASDNTYREFIAGLCDGGEITLECNYRPKATGQALITSNLHARTAVALVIVLPGALGTWTCSTCLVTGWSAKAAPGDKITGTATFKVSGKPVLS